MNIADYRRILDPELQPARFRRQPSVVAHLIVHATFVTGLLTGVALNIGWLPGWSLLALALLAGHSVGILAFAAHEIGHGAVLKGRFARWLTETIGWTYVLFTSSSVQRRAHNFLHHNHGNTHTDPDRRPTLEETATFRIQAWISTLIFPNSRVPWFCGLLGFHISICVYHINLLTHSVFKIPTRFNTNMTDKVRLQAVLEFGWNASVYAFFFALSGYSPWMALFLWGMYATATTLDGIYIATNHMLTGYHPDEHDPVAQTVTLSLPRWVDWMHLSFSHHTEHHLYPTAGPAFYPAIRNALRERFPDRYHELTLPQALDRLFGSPIAIAGPDLLADVDGGGLCPVTFALGAPTLEVTVPQAPMPLAAGPLGA